MLPQRYIKNPDDFSSGVPAVPLGFGYNLHKIAGGSPKLCFSASNVRPEGREACNPQIQIGIPY